MIHDKQNSITYYIAVIVFPSVVYMYFVFCIFMCIIEHILSNKYLLQHETTRVSIIADLGAF